jgi:RNA polymerase sigma-70 factor (ECF subfamily)
MAETPTAAVASWRAEGPGTRSASGARTIGPRRPTHRTMAGPDTEHDPSRQDDTHVGDFGGRPATGGRSTDQRTRDEDRDLVDAVLGGDRDAFRALVEREAPIVLAVCRRILADPTDAEDAAQDAFLTAYRKIGTFRGDGPLGGWLMRIAVREARDRALRRRPTTSLDDAVETLDIAVGDDPLASAEGHERRDSILAAIADLPAHYRDAVTLRYVNELSFAEIAQATGRPEATIRTHLHRGLLRLRKRLDLEARS